MLTILNEIAFSVCLRQEGHLFSCQGGVSAFCMRCTAWYGGIGIAMLWIFFGKKYNAKKLPPLGVSLWALGWLSLMGIDAGSDLLGWHHATMFSRILTGTMAGVGIPLFLLPILASFSIHAKDEQVITVRSAIGLWCLVASYGLLLYLIESMAVGFLWLISIVAVWGLGLLTYTVSRLIIERIIQSQFRYKKMSAVLMAVLILTLLYYMHSWVG